VTISEIKKWAKAHGYSIIKDKGDEEKGQPTQYYWSKENDVNATGVAPSVSKVATAIFNHMTDNKWVEHQIKFKEEKEYTKFTVTDYGT
jgi:hypothetical protein